jgi:hypothetical protein
LHNLFNPQFGIAEDGVSSFLVYEDYIHNIAKNSVLLSEHKDDVTNKQFIDDVIANIREFTDGLEESVLLHKKTDEEVMKENTNWRFIMLLYYSTILIVVKWIFHVTKKFCACFVQNPRYLRCGKVKFFCKLLVGRAINKPPLQNLPVSFRVPSGDPAVNVCRNFVC